MVGNKRGWKGNSHAHSLASKGIRTKYSYKSKGNPKLSIGLPAYSKDRIEHIIKLADGKEWIAELKMMKGDIIIDDIQISDKLDQSFLHWTSGDEKTDVGYIHYHPPELIPEFSSQDFVLAFNIHQLRTNKDEYPYTIMGLVYPSGDGHEIRMYGINPSKTKMEEFEGQMVTEKDLEETLTRMEASGELIKMWEKKDG